MNDKAVSKVHAALMKMSGIRAIKSGKTHVRDAGLLIVIGADEWRTRIRLTDSQGRVIGYYIDGQFTGTIGKTLELIY